jgi:hypothetical protein
LADIIQFRPRVAPPTFAVLRERAVEDITSDWERFAHDNHLNDYFIQSVPQWTEIGRNYLGDLNLISVVEQKVKLDLQITAPSYDGERLGWTASFGLFEYGLTVTPPMVFETYARCFAVLLFLRLKRDLLKL